MRKNRPASFGFADAARSLGLGQEVFSGGQVVLLSDGAAATVVALAILDEAHASARNCAVGHGQWSEKGWRHRKATAVR